MFYCSKKSGAGGVGHGINSPGLKSGNLIWTFSGILLADRSLSNLISGEKLCGVGITFVEDGNGALFVKSLVAGGSAALSGQIQVWHPTVRHDLHDCRYKMVTH
jgi:hypothetical protein